MVQLPVPLLLLGLGDRLFGEVKEGVFNQEQQLVLQTMGLIELAVQPRTDCVEFNIHNFSFVNLNSLNNKQIVFYIVMIISCML